MITYNTIGRRGRFANQLFQYASLCGIAKANNYEYGVPYENNLETNEYHRFCLPDCFENLEAKNSKNFNSFYKLFEKQFNYDENILNIPDNTDIVYGYFQSEKYFKHCEEDIKRQFKFKKNIENEALKIYNSFIDEEIISLHIRLGDYINNENHPVCSIEYYKKALDLLPKDKIIFIFSDDVEKAKLIFNSLNRKIIYPNTNDKFIDMCLMNKCDYHIIANSSFSWWGAWLANSKQTIAPSIWFGNNSDMPQNWSDIYCEGWIVV